MTASPARTAVGATAADDGVGRSGASARLLRSEIVAAHFTNVIDSDSHGAFDDFLRAGYLYYGYASALRSQVSVWRVTTTFCGSFRLG
jgi:hypothetical protein